MATLAAIALLGVGLVAYLVWRNGNITLVKTERWAAQRGLTLTSENRATVTGYLHTAGLLRGLGLAAGFALPALFAWALGVDQTVVPPWTWAFFGYLVGALYAEISLRRPSAGRAAAVPRRLRDYLRPLLRLGQVVVGGALVLASAGALGAPGSTDMFGHTSLPILVALAVAVVGTPALLGIESWLVRRPQPVLSPAQLAADDAIRSQSIQSVAASGMAMQLALLSIPLWAMASSDVQLLRWTMWVPGILSVVAALYVCLEFGHLRWQVRRPMPTGDREVTPC